MNEEIYHCIRCGFCTSRCVTLPEFGVESAGPRGRMLLLRGIAEGLLTFNEKVAGRLFQCTTCDSCSLSCPAGLRLSEIFEEFREEAFERGLLPENLRKISENVRKFGNPYGESSAIKSVRRGEKCLFIGCTTRFRRKETLKRVLEIAEMLEWSLVEEVCCGSPVKRIGDLALFRELVKRNYENLRKFSEVVVLCAGCYRTLSEDYRKFGAPLKVSHITEELAGMTFEAEIERATYHDPCHLGRAFSFYEPPRELLRKAGVELVEMKRNRENSRCCGGGGGFRALHPEVSRRIAMKRVEEASEVSEVLLTSCPFCHINLSEVSDELGVRVHDILDVLKL
ncbi:MAG: (Fe-S)-binding protein [Archaeoglobi archaeon]|nr:(Fe-S)-binding protein [Candidatus Mnemosynella bozhongmuii]